MSHRSNELLTIGEKIGHAKKRLEWLSAITTHFIGKSPADLPAIRAVEEGARAGILEEIARLEADRKDLLEQIEREAMEAQADDEDWERLAADAHEAALGPQLVH